MQIVMILVPLMLILVALGVLLFSWAVKNGQYDDMDGPAHRILYDDGKPAVTSRNLTARKTTRSKPIPIPTRADRIADAA